MCQRALSCKSRYARQRADSIKRAADAEMQAALRRLLTCVGLSRAATEPEMDGDLEALLEAPSAQRGPYFASSVSAALHALRPEDAC